MADVLESSLVGPGSRSPVCSLGIGTDFAKLFSPAFNSEIHITHCFTGAQVQ